MMSTVSDLLTDSGICNVELIKNCFLHIDAEAILRQPIGRAGQDFWAWDQKKTGVYSVRSAYGLLYMKRVEGAHDQQPSSSSCGFFLESFVEAGSPP